MAGPYLDPKKAQDFEKGFNQSGAPDVMSLANSLAKKFSDIVQPQEHSPEPEVEAAPDSKEMNLHMLEMQRRAEEAKQKYMKENGVDENGDLVR